MNQECIVGLESDLVDVVRRGVQKYIATVDLTYTMGDASMPIPYYF